MAVRLVGDASHTGTLTRIPRLLYGADYNPEQWPAEMVEDDIAAMREAGINIVSLGIFSWALLEPSRDEFDFEYLDRVIDRLHEADIAVDLATPTASPPAWLVHEHPEILPIDIDGVRLWHGSRRSYCPHGAAYRERAVQIATVMAERYREHPALAMWHVDNEYASSVSECFCDASVEAFRDWLERRYGDVTGLNEAWSTTFWGQRYSHWAQIQAPRRTPAFANPGQHLDWRRFWSDAWLACFDDQAVVLRAVTPEIPITTNFMHFYPPVDYWEWARHEDVVSDDYYAETHSRDWIVDAAMVADLMRSLGGGRPWMRMEQATAHVNWWPRNETKLPGIMRRASLQAVARGADGVLFFQWRASLGGSERFHSAMLPHAGKDTRTWREVVGLGEDLARLSDVIGSRVRSDVALLFDWENVWALQPAGLPSVDLDPMAELRAWYAAFFARGVTVDLAHPGADLSDYSLIVLPMLHLVDDDSARNIRAAVHGGAVAVMSYFSGIADATSRVRPGGYPGAFRDLVGLTVEEIVPFAAQDRNHIRTDSDGFYTSSVWADVIRVEGAKTVAEFTDQFYAGRPAVTSHRDGDGEAWYVGTRLEPEGMAWLVDRLLKSSGVEGQQCVEAPPGVEVVCRAEGERNWVFVLNHTDERIEAVTNEPCVEVLRGDRISRRLEVEAGDVAVLRMR